MHIKQIDAFAVKASRQPKQAEKNANTAKAVEHIEMAALKATNKLDVLLKTEEQLSNARHEIKTMQS